MRTHALTLTHFSLRAATSVDDDAIMFVIFREMKRTLIISIHLQLEIERK